MAATLAVVVAVVLVISLFDGDLLTRLRKTVQMVGLTAPSVSCIVAVTVAPLLFAEVSQGRRDLDPDVVAEGIENNEVMDRLVELGCDIGQGYGISRPLEVDNFDTWLATRSYRVPRIERYPAHP